MTAVEANIKFDAKAYGLVIGSMKECNLMDGVDVSADVIKQVVDLEVEALMA